MALFKHQRTVRVIGILLLTVLLVVLRLVYLDADAYPRLSWSSALLTDEGFYMHNARNLVLFGQARTDDFNNMLIMPLLHCVQVAFFRQFGVGVVQARLLTVLLSLPTLLVFFAALHRAFGARVAWTGLILLGLDPVFLLYNRLALMDSPACLPLCAALYAWTMQGRDEAREEGRGKREEEENDNGLLPLFLTGCCFGVAYCVRGLAGIAAIGPFALLVTGVVRRERANGVRLVAYMAGLALVLGIYGFTWWLPHRAELARVNSYYVYHQLVPNTLMRFTTNLYNAVLGDDRGMTPYLFRHTPITYGLTLLWLSSRRNCNPRPSRTNQLQGKVEDFAASWLLVMWLFLACISYAPDRYYVEFYPAMCLLAAVALRDINCILKEVWNDRWTRSLLGAWFSYHTTLVFLHSSNTLAKVAVYGVALVTFGTLALIPRNVSQWRERFKPFASLRGGIRLQTSTCVCILWAVVAGYWITDWLVHISYTQRDAERWLVQHLPANSVLIGDVAPGLCMNSRFRAINVIPGLCNDQKPVERFASQSGDPVYILILDGRFKEEWWRTHYPDLIEQKNRLHLFDRIVRLPVGIYRGTSGSKSDSNRK